MSTEIEERIQKLEEELEKLKSEVAEKEKESKNSNVRWRADFYECYYYVLSNGDILSNSEDNNDCDKDRYSIGNYFKTRKEAKHTAEILKVKQQLKDIALRLNNGEEIDWKNDEQTKYCIRLDITDSIDALKFYTVYLNRSIGEVYCLSKNFLKIAVQEIGYDTLIELIKSGV